MPKARTSVWAEAQLVKVFAAGIKMSALLDAVARGEDVDQSQAARASTHWWEVIREIEDAEDKA